MQWRLLEAADWLREVPLQALRQVRHLGQQQLLDKTHQMVELQHLGVNGKREIDAQTHSNVHEAVRKERVPVVDTH
jgi:hypothetical protein